MVALLACWAASAHGEERFWSFRPVNRPNVPHVKNAGWVRNPIDAFVLSKLEENGLAPAPPSEKIHLLRRAYFDLIGLPPKPEEVDAYLADTSPDAYEKVIDRLLASPHYGERWGRHWLDLVRYAETNGYERDGPKPNAWRYRDYVVNSFNHDKPYDRFIREQLAGDELETDVTYDTLIATGFYRLCNWDDEPDDKLMSRYDDLDDVVRTVGTAFLGLTINCARCHDHKFDPIPQRDYYSLLSFIQGVQWDDAVPLAPPEAVTKFKASTKDYDEKVKALEERIKAFAADAIDAKKAAEKQLDELRSAAPKPPYPCAMGIKEDMVIPPTHVLVRGNVRTPGPEVWPAFLSILTTPTSTRSEPSPGGKTSGRRRVLADWVAGGGNPLTSRVMANRLWQFHFGRGIVRTPGDFGAMGERPTHPELLDWIAAELVAGGWKMKAMHRLIMTSSTYRMSSRVDEQAAHTDPRNNWFSHFDLRRLEAEAVRDSILSASGRINLQLGGPSVFPKIPPEVLHGQSRPGDGWKPSPPVEADRRSIYVFVKRSLGVPILEAFDSADTGQSCAARNVTTIAPQALTMLNSEFLREQAAAFAERLTREAGADPEKQIERAYRIALSRRPTEKETAIARRLIERQGLASFCLVVLNLNEFIYVD